MKEITYFTPKSIDWPQIMEDIKEVTGTYQSVSIAMEVSWPATQRWRQGTEPGYGYGAALLEMHAHYCGEDLTAKRISDAPPANGQGKKTA